MVSLESEEVFRCLFEHSLDAILLALPDGTILAANPAACRMFGCTQEVICRLGRTGLVDVADARVDSALAERERSGFVRTELVFRRADGGRFPAEISTSNFLDPQGHPRTCIVIHDLTHRKQTEEALRQSEERFATIFRLSPLPTGISRFDTGAFVNVNDAFLKLFGYSRDEVLGRTSTELGMWPITEEREKLLSLLRAQGLAERFEAKFRRKTGEEGDLLIYAELMELNGQRCLLGTLQDITERKQMEAALRQSEERFSKAFFASPVAGSISTLTEGRLVEVNESYERLTGYTRSELLGRTTLELGFWREAVERERAERVLRQKQRIHGMEYNLRVKNGDCRRVLISLDVVEMNGVPHILALIYDITARQQAEDALSTLTHRLRHAQDEEQRRIARELHDATSQSMAATIMNLGMLEDLLPPGSARARKLLKDSVGLVEQCAQEVRTVSYLLHPPLLDQMGLLAALRGYVEGFSKRSGIAVEIVAPEQLGRLPQPIELALFRVAQESLGNIYRHSGSRRACLYLAASPTCLTLEISDEGRGMPPEVLKALQQTAATPGVGIAGMRERLDEIGGGLEISSDNNGTTVRALVPLPQAAESSPNPGPIAK